MGAYEKPRLYLVKMSPLTLQGGFSEVQLAKDNLTGKTVALKIVFLNKAGLQPDEVCAAVTSAQ